MKIILNIFLISSVTSVQPSFSGGEGKQVPKEKNSPYFRLRIDFFKILYFSGRLWFRLETIWIIIKKRTKTTYKWFFESVSDSEIKHIYEINTMGSIWVGDNNMLMTFFNESFQILTAESLCWWLFFVMLAIFNCKESITHRSRWPNLSPTQTVFNITDVRSATNIDTNILCSKFYDLWFINYVLWTVAKALKSRKLS